MIVVTLVIWPLFIRYFLKVAVWTAGLAALVVNGIIILIAAWISPSLQVDNLGWAILYSLVVSILGTVLLGLVPFGDVQLWRRLQRRMRGRTLDPSLKGKPGVIFLEIDGLSHDALLRAMAAGKAPTLKRWLDSGSHTLVGGSATSPPRPAPPKRGSCTATTRASPPSAGSTRPRDGSWYPANPGTSPA